MHLDVNEHAGFVGPGQGMKHNRPFKSWMENLLGIGACVVGGHSTKKMMQ